MAAQILFSVFCLLTGWMGWTTLKMGTTAFHEITAFLLFLTAAVFLVGIGVCQKLDEIKKELRRELRSRR